MVDVSRAQTQLMFQSLLGLLTLLSAFFCDACMSKRASYLPKAKAIQHTNASCWKDLSLTALCVSLLLWFRRTFLSLFYLAWSSSRGLFSQLGALILGFFFAISLRWINHRARHYLPKASGGFLKAYTCAFVAVWGVATG